MECRLCHQKLLITLSVKILFVPQVILSDYLCTSCRETFSRIDESLDKRCHNCCKLMTRQQTGGICQDCLEWQKIEPKKCLHHQALFDYNNEMKDFFKQFKFHGNYRLADTFALTFRDYLKPMRQKHQLIVPIPLADNRLRQRGFNQVEAMLQASQLPYCSLLTKEDTTQAQSEKTRYERLLTKQSFSVKKKYFKTIRHQSIILIDDIYTTGKTLRLARDCLLQQGVKTVSSVSLAR
ncbi:hypothetical protein CBF34_04550 [Vagococcus penaei]|uniref:Uncharacterized protein n=1 Tax=Vagococcus penaei TaxID=633807 RepID=A0A1Q2D4G3_9ENTE|nr:ComF family protein [Vagococcus penaei]AQP53300.1 hypothetical protein BW732_02975 [Vagococcus penaei]RSU04069.1 hypothetical protein CBF34_04550 [Vagococcus penaei]